METQKIFLRSKESKNFYSDVYGIMFLCIKLFNNDIISLVMEYFTKNPIGFCFGNEFISDSEKASFGDIYKNMTLFTGDYVNVCILTLSNIYASKQVVFLNIKEHVGIEMSDVSKKAYNIPRFKNTCDKNLSDKRSNPKGMTNKIYLYGALSIEYIKCVCGSIFRECDCKGDVIDNQELDDARVCLYNFCYSLYRPSSKYFTQIRKGRDITQGTKFDEIIKLHSDDYFFAYTSPNNMECTFLIKLSESEYECVLDEINEINLLAHDKTYIKHLYSSSNETNNNNGDDDDDSSEDFLMECVD